MALTLKWKRRNKHTHTNGKGEIKENYLDTHNLTQKLKPVSSANASIENDRLSNRENEKQLTNTLNDIKLDINTFRHKNTEKKRYKGKAKDIKTKTDHKWMSRESLFNMLEANT